MLMGSTWPGRLDAWRPQVLRFLPATSCLLLMADAHSHCTSTSTGLKDNALLLANSSADILGSECWRPHLPCQHQAEHRHHHPAFSTSCPTQHLCTSVLLLASFSPELCRSCSISVHSHPLTTADLKK